MRKLIERCVIDDCPITIDEHYTKKGTIKVALERAGHEVRMVQQGSGNGKRVRQVRSPYPPMSLVTFRNYWAQLYAGKGLEWVVSDGPA